MGDFILPRLSRRRDSGFAPLPPAPIAPVADFSHAVQSRTVTFTDLSTDTDGTIVAWDWDFGDAVAPSQSPTAAFSYVVNGLTATFTDSSTDPDGTVTAWSWNFGDGTTSTQQHPVKTYAAAGSYSVTLTVTDNASNQSTPLRKVVRLGAQGRPFGVSQFWATLTAPEPNTAVFDLSQDSVTADNIIRRIDAARSLGVRLMFNMTGGAHSNYLTNGKFDPARWRLKMDTFNTAAIRTAVADAVADETGMGNSMVDEPPHSTWGGVITKAMLDDMADYGHGIFPTLPMGVTSRYDFREPIEKYLKVDFVLNQYSFRLPDHDPGNVILFRDEFQAMCSRNNVVGLSGLNILDGGYKSPTFPDITVTADVAAGAISISVAALAKKIELGALLVFSSTSAKTAVLVSDAPQGDTSLRVAALPTALVTGDIVTAVGCPLPFTGGTGTHSGNCSMSPGQLTYYGDILMRAFGAFRMWRYGSAYMANAANKAAFQQLADLAATLSRPRWSLRL